MRAVILYVDYENLRYWQTHAFEMVPLDLNVVKLGELIASRRHEPSILREVRVYRGTPHPRLERKKFERQLKWGERLVDDGRATLISRPLKYFEAGGRSVGFEKGIDVALAIDLVAHPFRHPGAAAILVSRDDDLSPALEAFVDLAVGNSPIEVVSCRSLSRLRLGESWRPWCHQLSREDFEAIRDDA
jgi:hypothetical protein